MSQIEVICDSSEVENLEAGPWMAAYGEENVTHGLTFGSIDFGDGLTSTPGEPEWLLRKELSTHLLRFYMIIWHYKRALILADEGREHGDFLSHIRSQSENISPIKVSRSMMLQLLIFTIMNSSINQGRECV